MQTIFNLYETFLSIFPANYHGIISVILAILLVYSIFKVLQKEFIWLIVLIILLPASIPILINIWEAIVEMLKFLINKN